jgi:SnoaL-like domain
MTDSPVTEIDVLLAERAIRDVILRFFRGIDRADEKLLRAAFHDGAVFHRPDGETPASQVIDAIVRVAFPGYLSTSHFVTNILIEVRGDIAFCESCIFAVEEPAGDAGTGAIDLFCGRCVDRFERRNGAWKIAERTLVHDWAGRTTAAPLNRIAGTMRAGARDRSDPVYSAAEP